MPDGSIKRKKIIKKTTIKYKELTDEQIEEIDIAFKVFDKDRSGSIDIGELKDAMKALGVFLKKQEVRDLMRKVDKDGSGAIDKDEFRALMAEQIEVRDQEKELQKIFRIFDDDDNGMITNENLMRCAKDSNLRSETEVNEQLESKVLNEMITMGDLDGKGGVDYNDFFRLMQELDLFGDKKKIHVDSKQLESEDLKRK